MGRAVFVPREIQLDPLPTKHIFWVGRITVRLFLEPKNAAKAHIW
jgi:hypothetical protein